MSKLLRSRDVQRAIEDHSSRNPWICHMPTVMIPMLSAIFFAALAAIATCAPAAISLLSPINGTLTTYQCTGSQKWAAPDFRRRECYMTVVSEAFLDELKDFGDEPVEFFTDTGGGLSPLRKRLTDQAVPRKYTSGKSVNQALHPTPHTTTP